MILEARFALAIASFPLLLRPAFNQPRPRKAGGGPDNLRGGMRWLKSVLKKFGHPASWPHLLLWLRQDRMRVSVLPGETARTHQMVCLGLSARIRTEPTTISELEV